MDGIHLILNGQGRPSGQAFVQVEHEEDIGKALEKHRQYLGPRYVQGVSLCDPTCGRLESQREQDMLELGNSPDKIDWIPSSSFS